jgi:putative membrane protein
MSELNLEQKYNKWIIAVSIIIPVAVAFLLELNLKISVMMLNLFLLPPIYATTNGITAVLLIAGVISIKMVSVSFIDHL